MIGVAWQTMTVKGRGGGPFLAGDPADPHLGYALMWRNLRCEHHGPTRTEWTPWIVRVARTDGQVRQTLVVGLPTIRSCCIADPFHRTAWWHDVEWAFKIWRELGESLLADELAGAEATILTELRAVIPRPTPAGVRDFAAWRADRDAEDQARDEAIRSFWTRRLRVQEPTESARPEPRPAECFAVLGLKASATLDQVKASHRRLAKQHHPDRGGEPTRFREIQTAYERAVADLARRQPG